MSPHQWYLTFNSPHTPLSLSVLEHDIENPSVRIPPAYIPRCHWCSRQSQFPVVYWRQLTDRLG